ncbi:glycosyltransferase [Vibrio coralliilyticus]|uniref:glycosyltransferase n=1 Tax=Vibrio TaxID=662 RepID=UPI0005075596|nr:MULTISPECIES: glycosyltransferase [Vibrio]KFI10401.1 two-domain glycosyltransferase [Vibrio sp. B183]NOI16708.1 glycosyltransferase [Vibrio coralliilyticus]
MLISIIIPTYNCANLLEKTLESLCQQSLQTEYFEVIVADDGSSDNTEQLVKSFASRLNIGYCFQPDLGFRAASARNLGSQQAVGEYLFYLDSGVVLEQHALQIHLAEMERNPDHIQIGFCHGFEEHFVANNTFSQLLDSNDFNTLFDSLTQQDSNLDCRQQLLNQIGHMRGFDTHPWLFFWGGHLFAKTSDFIEAGGFDENFTHWGGEDVELGLRLFNAGHKFTLLLDAKAYHIPHPKAETAGSEATHNNCHYIHDKHQLPITERMLAESWEDIVRSVS